MIAKLLSLALLVSAVAAACGPAPEAESPTAPQPEGEEPSDGKTTAEGPDASPEDRSSPPTAATPSVPIAQSQLLGEVGKLGLTMKKLPTLKKMPLGQKKKIMPFFQQALGYKDCGGCHQKAGEDFDYKTETHHMKIARTMWDEFVVKLRDEKGEAIFCDSCHQQKTHLLNRSDQEALKKFMEDEYQNKLDRGDGKEHSCSTCHGDPFEPKIIEKLWKIAPP